MTTNNLWDEVHKEFSDDPEMLKDAFETCVRIELKSAIRKAGKTQTEVAEGCGWNKSYLSRLLTGKIRLTFAAISRICHYLGIRPRLLLETLDLSQTY